MFRFFISTKIEDPSHIVIKDKEIVKKLTKVLRKKVGDTFFVFDIDAEEYEVEIKEISAGQIACKTLNRNFVDRELPVEINLFQSLLKIDKLEWVFQKVTEIGVRKIIPIVSENCVVKEFNKNKISRYQKIIQEATLQSGGKIQPQLTDLLDFNDAIQSLQAQALNLIAHEQEQENLLKNVLAKSQAKTINIFIGPEGGFSDEEINLALRNSVTPFSLGKRILRAETAAIVACGTISQLFVY